jgi:hypothetical protein
MSILLLFSQSIVVVVVVVGVVFRRPGEEAFSGIGPCIYPTLSYIHPHISYRISYHIPTYLPRFSQTSHSWGFPSIFYLFSLGTRRSRVFRLHTIQRHGRT